MDFNFDDWKKTLEDFQKSVSKDLEEIRLHKEEVRQLKEEIYSAKNGGYFLRDDHRIVISAPEIVIGNVDRDGTLRADSGSQVVLRATAVGLDGVGSAGQVLTRAASIRQVAADPGSDGMEAVVGPLSEVVSQAGSIVLEGNATAGVFSKSPHSAGNGGVRIHADGQLQLEAAVSADLQKQNLDAQIKDLETQKSEAEAEAQSGIKDFASTAKAIQSIYEQQEKMLSDVMVVRTEVDALSDFEEQMDGYAAALYQSYEAAARSISRLAEINRQITCLKAEQKSLKKADEFKKNPTGSAVSVIGERIDLVSRDGDNNLRDNPEAGVGILANNISIGAIDSTNALQKEGKVAVNAKTVEISTLNTKDEKFDDKGKQQGGTYTAEGDVFIKSKNVSIESVDWEYKDDKLQEKALTKEGSLNIRVEKMDVSATDTEGKATGSISLNAKDVSVRSMDVEKEKRTDDKLAAGSTMLLLSEKMFLGAKKKDIKSKKLQAVSEEMGLFADKTFEAQQDEGKATLQLAGGKAALGGSDTQVFGKTTVNNTLEAKGEFKAPKATVDHVEAKSSFKSSNISDGIPVPPAPPSGNLSAKLKAEDAPEKK
jgi:hypothetical protein